MPTGADGNVKPDRAARLTTPTDAYANVKIVAPISTAGVCGVCEKWADRRYGGMGRYLPMCIDCWELPEKLS